MIALASDFDGTLYFSEETPNLHPEDIKAIQKFQAEGNLFGLCTGRPFRFSANLISDQVSFDFFICSTGSYVAEKEQGLLFEAAIPYESACRILEEAAGPVVSFHLDQEFYLYQSCSYPEELKDVKVIRAKEELKNHQIHNISFRMDNEEDAKKMTERLNAEYGQEIAAFQNKIDIDIVAVPCSKGMGLLHVKKQLGLESIAAIGDSYNDIPMLEAADESFTFHSSPTQVKNKASHLVHGLYEAIEKLLDKNQ